MLPVIDLWMAALVLALIYTMLSVMTVRRALRVSRFVRRWNSQRMLYWMLVFHTIVRVLSYTFIVTDAVLSNVLNSKQETVETGPLLVILLLAPEFIFLSAYGLIFLHWVETNLSSFDQYAVNVASFERLWKKLYFVFVSILVLLQLVFFISLCIGPVSSQTTMLNIIFFVLMCTSFSLPCMALFVFCIFSCCVLVGFPFTSQLARQRVLKLTWILLIWSLSTLSRGLSLWFFFIDKSWTSQVDIEEFSVIVIASVLFAEVVPISATQASSLLPLFVVNIDEAASAHAYHQLSPFRHYHDWRISYSELSIQRRGSVSRSVSTAVAVWRRKQVFVQKYSLESMSQSVIEELLDETCASASVSHPHLLPLIGVCLLPHQAVVVTEYMPRGSLRDLQRNATNPLTDGSVLRLMQQLCDVMQFLSSRSPPIVHGHLSSSSVLLDGGMSVRLSGVGQGHLCSFVEVIMATEFASGYTAPELLNRAAPSSKSDVYSFGMVFYALATGSEPFANRSHAELRVEVLRRRNRPAIPASVHPHFSQVIRECWSEDAEVRPSFSELQRMLADIACRTG